MNPKPCHDTNTDEQDARSAVESYTRAVTAREMATAARFTCRETPGLLWVGAVGRPITVLSIWIGVHPIDKSPLARAVIQVAGMPESTLYLKKVDGHWCVFP